MRIVLGLIVSGAASVCAYIYFSYALWLTLPIVGFCLWRALKEHEKEQEAHGTKVDEAEARLKSELLATHHRLFKTPDLGDAIRDDVLTLLIDAAKHLDEPVGSSRLYYEDDSCLKHKLNGLGLVQRAQALINDNTEELIDNFTPGSLFIAIREKDEKAIHVGLIGKTEALGFVGFHPDKNPNSIGGWFQQCVNDCKAMGFELRFKTIRNSDSVAAASEQYKTIAYISY